MRNIVCPHCQQSVSAPDDLDVAHCVRCGRVIAMETGITAEPAPMAPSSQTEYGASDSRHKRSRREAVTTWEEFRASSPSVQHELLQLVSRPLPDLRGMAAASLPADRPPIADEWGEPIGSIAIPAENASNRWTLVVLFLGGGLFMAWIALSTLTDARQRDEPSGAFFALDTGFVSIAIGAYLLASIWRGRMFATLWVFEDGVLLHRGGRWEFAEWDHIEEFEISIGTGRPLYWLTMPRRSLVTISAGFSDEVVPLMEYIELRLAAAQFLRRLEAIWHGRAQRFGDVTLNSDGLRGPRFFAAWKAVRRVVSDAQTIFVDCDGSVRSLPYRDVSFPYLVIAISHVMVEEYQQFLEN